jgi:uncharacterized membrane protein SpoIIM required for sporulation
MTRIYTYTLASITIWIVALGVAFYCFDAMEAPPQSHVVPSAKQQQLPPEDIMENNLRCTLLNMSGIAFAGIPTVLNLFYNGFLTGIVLRQYSSTSLPFSEIYFYGRNHAIEFLALWLSGGIGLCGIFFFRVFFISGKVPDKNFLYLLSISACIAVLITIVAAVLETNVSLAAYYKPLPTVRSVDSLIIIPRDMWLAHPFNTQPSAPYRADSMITSVIIHHSGFPGNTNPLRLQEYQMNIRGMDDMAYHYYITSAGCVYEGRPLSIAGQHTAAGGGMGDPNAVSIGICLGGNFETDSAGPALHQRIAFRRILDFVRSRYHITIDHILFHRDFNNATTNALDSVKIEGTVCPGRFAINPLSQLIDTLEGL